MLRNSKKKIRSYKIIHLIYNKLLKDSKSKSGKKIKNFNRRKGNIKILKIVYLNAKGKTIEQYKILQIKIIRYSIDKIYLGKKLNLPLKTFTKFKTINKYSKSRQ